MNRILYEARCRCKEEIPITKRRKSVSRREGRPLPYPEAKKITSKTFYIEYNDRLSMTGKFLLNSFQNKYIYYAIDDILETFQNSPVERDQLLGLIYSPILSLQNHFSINFFDIWIRQVYIEEIVKPNKFLTKESEGFIQFTSITIEFIYNVKAPVKKPEALW